MSKRLLPMLAAASLLAGLPAGWCGRVFADDSPEQPKVRCGIIALTDCSPFVVAAEKGFFKKYVLQCTIAKGANWAAIRDALSNGDNQFTHMLIGMPILMLIDILAAPSHGAIASMLGLAALKSVPVVVRMSQPRPIETAVRPGASLVSETFPPLLRLTPIVYSLPLMWWCVVPTV